MALVAGLLALILGAAFVLLVVAVGGQRDAAKLALRSQEAITAGTELEKTVITMENGLRGYVASGNARRLQPWNAGLKAYPGQVRALERLVSLRVAVPRLHDGHFHAAVTHVDRFGNLSINVDAVAAAEAGIVVGALLDVAVEGHHLVIPFGETYTSVPPAEPVVTEDSHGRLAVCVNLGSAADRFGASLGSKVLVGPAGSVGGG